MILRLLMTISAWAALGACQTAPRPATLEASGPEEVEALRRVLAEALGRGRVELGAGDLTGASVISVLPPPPTPLEGNSPAMPELFDLVLTAEGCFVRRRSTGDLFLLPGITCRPAR
jgi:hypothetical protein